MPRPCKRRRVCCMPVHHDFVPARPTRDPPVILGVDEYEVIRLLDLESLTQEECAIQMGIGRTTVTGIYDRSRRKIADALVNGRALHIEGGDYAICTGPGENCPEISCHRHCNKTNRRPMAATKKG